MRALTVCQPWAWAIFHGKDVENRTQLWKYRGPLAIHAGARVSDRGMRSELVRDAWREHGHGDPLEALAIGAVLGVVDLVDTHVAAPGCCESLWGEQSYVEHGGKIRNAIVHMALENAREFSQPILGVKGRLGLRQFHDDRPEDMDLLDAIKAAA